MASFSSPISAWLRPALFLLMACSDNTDAPAPDAAAPGCDPATVLPSNFRLIAATSAGTVDVTTTSDVTSGTIDATAGGTAASADNPYIYVDLKAGTKVDVTDVAARTSTAWDLALKRQSIRLNSGDSGSGNRELATVEAATLAEVTAAPTTGYATDDFTTADCTLDALPAGDPNTVFGQWYAYSDTHMLTPEPLVYVIKRADGSRTAFRIVSYYDSTMTRGALYSVEWKQLP